MPLTRYLRFHVARLAAAWDRHSVESE